jgi:hypothetical protein
VDVRHPVRNGSEWDVSTSRKPLQPDELKNAAEIMGEILEAIPPEEDRPRDAMVRRRVEGANAATELAAGEDSPRTSEDPS